MIERCIDYISQHKRHIAKYLLVGGVAFGMDFTSFYVLLTMFAVPLYVATTTGLVIGFIASFIGNRNYVFSASEDSAHNHTVFMQVLMYGLLLGFNSIFAYVFILGLHSLDISYPIAKLGSMVSIVIWNFFIYKTVIFKIAIT